LRPRQIFLLLILALRRAGGLSAKYPHLFFLSLRSKPLEELAPGGALLPWREPLAAWSGSPHHAKCARDGDPGLLPQPAQRTRGPGAPGSYPSPRKERAVLGPRARGFSIF
jgi:hypothetical protein